MTEWLNESIDQDNVSLNMLRERTPNAIVTDTWCDIQGKMMESDDANYTGLSEYQLADAYAAMYLQPGHVRMYDDAPGIVQSWWGEFMSGPGKVLREMTVGDVDLSERLAWSVARHLQRYLDTASDDAGTDEEDYRECKKRWDSVHNAADEASKDMEQAKDMRDLGIEDMKDCYRRTSRNAQTLAILQMAGQMIRFALAKRKEQRKGNTRVGGVVYGNDVAKLASSEFGAFAHPLLELDLMRRIVERQALNIRKFDEDPMGRGPVVVVVDESGSMRGTEIIMAKALALTLARLARQDKRWIYFVGFADIGQENHLCMPHDEWDEGELMNWIEHFFGGGTDFDVLYHISQRWNEMDAPVGKTDVVFITDGHDAMSPEREEAWNKWRKDNHVTAYGISLTVSDKISHLVDQSWSTQEMGLEDPATMTVLSEV